MKLFGSSRVPAPIPDRVRRFFFMELSRCPGPPPQKPGVKLYRAWRYWERNVRGVPFVVTTVAVFFVVLGCALIELSRALPWVSVLLILTGIGVPLVLFPGKVAAVYPYAVEIEEGKGLRFYSPLGDIYLPIEHVKTVKWSWLFGGWAVTLKERYGLLGGFLIHFAWGRQGRELAQAIREELARRGR